MIELVVGMLIMAIAISLLSTLLLPLSDRSVGIKSRVLATELAHSLMNEIWILPFDENTLASLSSHCASSDSPDKNIKPCSLKSSFGHSIENKSRDDFEDVDDYSGLNEKSQTAFGAQTYMEAYPNFKLKVDVNYVNEIGQDIEVNETSDFKLITITVTTPPPNEEKIILEAIKGNY